MNRLLALLLFAPSLCLAQLPNYVPAEDLVAWYPLDGDALDLSGLGHHGIVNGPMPTIDRFGNSNGAYHFNDASSISANLEGVGNGNVPVTISSWVHTEQTSTDVSYVAGVGDAPYVSEGTIFGMGEYGGSGLFSTMAGGQFDAISGTAIPLNQWVMLTAVHEGDGSVQLYVDGTKIFSFLGSPPNIQFDVALIGTAPWGGSFWSGDIDEVGIWSRALTEEEVQAMFLGAPIEYGCTDSQACNYDEEASADDGNCIYPPEVDLGADIWTPEQYVFLDAGTEADYYWWDSGGEGPSIQVDQSGVYSVTASHVDLNPAHSLEFHGDCNHMPSFVTMGDVFDMESSFTLGAWVFNDGCTNMAVIDKAIQPGDSGFVCRNGYSLTFDGYHGAIAFNLQKDWSGLCGTSLSNGNYQSNCYWQGEFANQWMYLMGVFDSPNQEMKLYVNGVCVDSADTHFSHLNDRDSEFLVGAHQSSGDWNWTGLIDDVSVWDTALNPQDVLASMSCPLSGNEDGLVGYWTFDEGEGMVANDQSPSGIHGSILGPTFSNSTPPSTCPSCASTDSIQVTFLSDLCGEGTAWDPNLGTCVGLCDEAQGQCGQGTIWDPINEECIIAIPADLNFDGCVTVSDLLELLTVHGTCPPYPEWPDEPTDTTWTCGDPVTYWDYDYATVLISDQCWFAENLATAQYTDGSVIDSGLSNSEWASTTTGAQAAYDDDEAVVSTHGRLYNGYAVDDSRGLCPTNWSVPTDSDFIHLEENLGMSTEEATSLYWRGSDEGQRLKSTTWQNGLDEVGFSALPHGGRNHSSGNFLDDGAIGYWWTKTFNIDGLFYRRLDSAEDRIFRTYPSMNYGFSVRCIKD